MTTPDDALSVIRARVDAATPGPWESERTDPGEHDQGFLIDRMGAGMASSLVAGTYDHGDRAAANAEFIAHARDDVPRLLAVVDAVLALRVPFEWSFGEGPVRSCRHCADQGADETRSQWPCPTVVAVTNILNKEEA